MRWTICAGGVVGKKYATFYNNYNSHQSYNNYNSYHNEGRPVTHCYGSG
jgi:hypothetical protein